MPFNFKDLEEKWQTKWENARVFESNPDPIREKFFITVAYPYPNSPQHVGHGRTFTLTDVYARYKRMRGFNVLFPMAFHYTGTPILAMAKRVAANDEELIQDFINIYNVPKEVVKTFTEPIKIASYFHHEIKRGMKEIGYSIDWRREFTTIEPQYNRFIEWQFKKLKNRGLITRGSHPVGWCPSCESPMGQHDTEGDVEPNIVAITLIEFKLEGPHDVSLPTGTLRPETLFGVTNLWIRPDIDYVHAKVNGKNWVISQECAKKLVMLNYKVEVKGKVSGKTFIGKYVRNPLTSKKLIIMPAAYLDPKNATGIVMSVPGHSPHDYIALEDLKKNPASLLEYNIKPIVLRNIEPISLISLNGYSEFPALDALRRLGALDQFDKRVEEATKEVYSQEFHRGKMKENTGKYAGLLVANARQKIEKDLFKEAKAFKMYELLNQPIYCRCGSEIVVKIFEDQWFINYGDKEWKKLAHACLDSMKITPEDLVLELNNVIDWLREKACARKHGLGTKLPWDQKWIVESLSDSVIYMSYYTISRIIREENVLSDKLSDEVLDYVFLGLGDPEIITKKQGFERTLLKRMRHEFLYFYPLDSRNSGRDLVPNHLAFFIFNHAAIFNPDLWPKLIVVNGSVLMKGKKMSKSFGNIIPLRQALKSYRADPLRLAVLASAELLQDADFSPTLAASIKNKLKSLYNFALEIIAKEKDANEKALKTIDKWMVSRLQQHIKNVTQAMEELRFRQAIQIALYLLDQDIQWYLKRTSQEKERKKMFYKILHQVLETKILFLAPFAPHLCEEIWHQMGKENFISTAKWPSFDESKIDEIILMGEERVKALEDDISKIMRVTHISPQKICLYFASKWKWNIYLKALELAQKTSLNMKRLMELLLADPNLRKRAKQVSAYAAKTVPNIKKSDPGLIRKHIKLGYLDEHQILGAVKDFYQKEFKAQIEMYNEDDEKIYDPKNRASLAEPYRPAIFIE